MPPRFRLGAAFHTRSPIFIALPFHMAVRRLVFELDLDMARSGVIFFS
jgi:hypothetical protein